MKKTKHQTTKENLQSIGYALAIFLTIMLLAMCSITAQSQNVVRKGNTFTEIDTVRKEKPTVQETDLIYVDKEGHAYTIYLSSTGKAFIKKVSKKSGKEYRKYLPKVTEELNK